MLAYNIYIQMLGKNKSLFLINLYLRKLGYQHSLYLLYLIRYRIIHDIFIKVSVSLRFGDLSLESVGFWLAMMLFI